MTISISSDNEANLGTGRNDPNSFTISYVGPGNLTSFTFNPSGSDATAGGTVSGRNGLTSSTASAATPQEGYSTPNTYFNTVTPGVYFSTTLKAFTIGSGSSAGFTTTNTTLALTNVPVAPAPQTSTGKTATITFAGGNFSGGNVFRFTVGRGLQRGSNVTATNGAVSNNYSADIFGGGVLLPEGTGDGNGMTFSATTSDGGTFTGRIVNRIGSGWSKVDGFGFINAEAAIAAPIQ